MTEEQWEGLLKHISEGGSVRKYGRDLGSEDTIGQQVARRLREDDAFCQQYARSKQFGIEMRLDRLSTLIEESKPEEVAKTRLIWDHERWEASKLLPKKYGDKLQTEHSGEVKTTYTIIADESKL